MSEESQSLGGAPIPPLARSESVASEATEELEEVQQPPLKRQKARRLTTPGPPSPTLEELELLAAQAAQEPAEAINQRLARNVTDDSDDEESGARKTKAKSGNDFRFAGKMVAGTIARCALAPDLVAAQLAQRAGIKNCTSELNFLVVQELHEDGHPHIHFFIECKGDKKLQIRGNLLSARYPYAMNLKAVYNRAKWIKYLLKEQAETRLDYAENDGAPNWHVEAQLPGQERPGSLVEAWPWLTEPTIEQALDRYYKEVVKGDPKLLAKFAGQVNQLKSLWEIYQRSEAVCKELNERVKWLQTHPFGGLAEALRPLAAYIDRSPQDREDDGRAVAASSRLCELLSVHEGGCIPCGAACPQDW